MWKVVLTPCWEIHNLFLVYWQAINAHAIEGCWHSTFIPTEHGSHCLLLLTDPFFERVCVWRMRFSFWDSCVTANFWILHYNFVNLGDLQNLELILLVPMHVLKNTSNIFKWLQITTRLTNSTRNKLFTTSFYRSHLRVNVLIHVSRLALGTTNNYFNGTFAIIFRCRSSRLVHLHSFTKNLFSLYARSRTNCHKITCQEKLARVPLSLIGSAR